MPFDVAQCRIKSLRPKTVQAARAGNRFPFSLSTRLRFEFLPRYNPCRGVPLSPLSLIRRTLDRLRLALALFISCAAIAGADPTPTTQPTTAPAVIDSFQGQYRFLSNFWPAEVQFEGLIYPTAEHAYQAAKTPDRAERQRIAALPTPGDAKRAGAALPKRPDWDAKKLAVMELVVRDKFTRNPDLRAKLLATHHAQLIEGNTWNDQFWGVCNGKGENHLGRILMKVRDELRSAPTTAPAAPARSKG